MDCWTRAILVLPRKLGEAGPSKNVGGGGGGIYLVANYDHIPIGTHNNYEICR